MFGPGVGFRFGHTVQVIYPAAEADPFAVGGDAPVSRWPDLAGATVTVTGDDGVPLPVPIAPVWLGEHPVQVRAYGGPSPGTQSEWTDQACQAYFPYAYPIDATCQVEVLDGPYQGRWHVEGTPDHWMHPWTGWEAGTVVRLYQPRGDHL